jgi:hypothetical protein
MARAGLNIPDTLSGFFRKGSTQAEWEQSRDAFCRLDAAFLSSNAQAAQTVRQASEIAYGAVVNCAEAYARASKDGLFGALTVDPDRAGFALKVFFRPRGSQKSEIPFMNVEPTKSDPQFSCTEGLHNARREAPITYAVLEATIACRKNPDLGYQVAVNTAHGTLGPYYIASVTDDLAALKERVQAIEASALPSGAVVWTEKGCPAGWQVYEKARGRTIVGAGNTVNVDNRSERIPGWAVGGTGGEVNHVLTIPEMPVHDHDFVGQRVAAGGWGGSVTTDIGVGDEAIHRRFRIEGEVRERGGSQPHNTMPPFISLTPCIRP